MKRMNLGLWAFAFILFLASCEKELDVAANLAKIESIASATNKQVVSKEELPVITQNILNTQYAQSVMQEARLAPALGYEILLMRVEGIYSGEHNRVYFDLEGRHISRTGEDDEDEEHEGEGEYGEEGDYHDCEDGEDYEECFDIVFPITFIMPDGVQLTFDSEEVIEEGLKDWYEAHPDSEEEPSLVYPVTISFEDDASMEINSEEELKEAFERCKDWDEEWDERDCFDKLFPLTFIMPNGDLITVNNEEEAETQIKDWYETHDSEERPTLSYPVTIEYEDGTTATINSDEEMEQAHLDCE